MLISANNVFFSSSLPGIPPHVDTTSAFEDGLMSLSIGSQVNHYV